MRAHIWFETILIFIDFELYMRIAHLAYVGRSLSKMFSHFWRLPMATAQSSVVEISQSNMEEFSLIYSWKNGL